MDDRHKIWSKDARHYVDKQTDHYMRQQIHGLIRQLEPYVFTKLGKWIDTKSTLEELSKVLEKATYDFLIILKQRWIAAQGQAGNLPLGDILPKRSN